MPDALPLDPRLKLRTYFAQLGGSRIPSALHLLVYTRELIEFLGESAFPVARLYGNWAVHTKISGSAAGYDLLSRANTHLASIPPTKGHSDDITPFLEEMSKSFATATLLDELRTLFEREGLSAPFLDSQPWPHVLADVFNEVRGKPIQWPQGDPAGWRPAVRTQYDSARAKILSAFGHTRPFVKSVVLDLVPDADAKKPSTLYWHCYTERGFLIRAKVSSAVFGA